MITARISKKRVATRIKRRHAQMAVDRAKIRVHQLQTLWDWSPAASNAGAIPFDQILTAGADRDAAAREPTRLQPADQRELVAADHGEHIDVGEGEGSFGDVDQRSVLAREVSECVVAAGGHPALDADRGGRDFEDLEVSGGDEGPWRGGGGVAVYVEPGAYRAAWSDADAERVWNG